MKAVDRSDWNFCRVRVDEDGAVEWLKNNRSTDVGDIPLWVLMKRLKKPNMSSANYKPIKNRM